MALAKVEIEAVHKTKVYKTVADQLQRKIRDGQIKVGDWLPPERELAKMIHVSRSSLLDAIRNLAQLGLLEARHGEGTVVRDPSAESLVNPLATLIANQRELLSDLLEFRRMIEPTLAARAAAHASAEEITQMAEILGRQKEKVDRGELAIEEEIGRASCRERE